jgi:peptidoglycan hydrolase-like protein with peptidoglycan-binding domain/DNA invertase Pin-like site-specific DNA recombinase
MRRTYDVPFSRAGLAGLLAALTLLCLPGTSIAGGASESSPALAAGTGLLQYGDGYGAASGAPPVRAVQRTLRSLGWQPGPVDGLYGPRTQAAVTRFQSASGLTADGVVGPGTRQALNNAQREPLRRGAGFAQPGGSSQVRELQADLRREGLSPGPVDGLFGPRTQAAVERLQRANGVPVSGAATADTRRVLATGDQPAGDEGGERASNEPGASDEPGASEPAPGATPDIADEPVPVAAETGDDSGGVGVPVAIAIGLAALLAGLLGGTLLGRREPAVSGTAIPLAELPRAEREEVPRIVPRVRAGRLEPIGTELERVRVLGYVSTPLNSGIRSEEFGDQLNAIDAYCDERGWDLVEVVQDVDTNRARERQGLLYALEKIGRGEASCIIVAELGRLSRSAADLGGILDRLERSDGRLVALDVGLDTASAEGRVAAQALTSVGAWEHERTAGRLAAVSAPPSPVLEPREAEDVGALKQRIVEMREGGMTLQAIADVLNAEGVPTLRGGAKWRPSSVQSAAGYRRPPKPQRE